MARPYFLAVLLLVAVLLSACAGTDDAVPSKTVVEAAAPAVTADAGSVTGVVTDEQLLPVLEARVGLVELKQETLTDLVGRYTFNGVPPGSYRLTVMKLGFESRSQAVTVKAGEITRSAVQLAGLGSDGPHYLVQSQVGLIKCSARWSPGIPTGGAPGVPDPVTGAAACGLANEVGLVNETIGDQFRLHWRVPKGAQEVQLEQVWQSNQPLGRGLSVYLEVDEKSQANAAYGRVTGLSPLTVYADEARMDKIADAFPEARCLARGCAFQTRVFVEANTTGMTQPVPLDVGLVVDQKFTQYLVAFYGMTRPSGFSAVPDGS